MRPLAPFQDAQLLAFEIDTPPFSCLERIQQKKSARNPFFWGDQTELNDAPVPDPSSASQCQRVSYRAHVTDYGGFIDIMWWYRWAALTPA